MKKLFSQQGAYQINTTYKGFTVSNSITVFKELESIISIDVADVNYMENVCLNVSVLPKYMHGNLTIRIISNNEVLFEFNARADKAFSKKLKGLNASDYLVTVNFTDMDKYYASNDFSTFKVFKINPKIIVVADAVEFNQDAKITVNIPNVRGNVTIRVGDVLNFTEYLPKDGVIVKTISKLNSGEYPIYVKFEGNNNYNPFNTTTVLKVNKMSTSLKLSYVNNTYNSVTLTAVVNSSSAGGNVVFTVNGKDYTVKISRGKVTYELSDLGAGSYTVNAVYKGDTNHKTSTSNSIKFTVPKVHVNIAASDVTKNYGGSEKLAITLTNLDSKAVGNAKIKVSLAGKDYTLTTDGNGKASLDLNLDSGNYIANIVFAGNNDYLPENTSAKVTINQLTSNIALSYTKNSYNSITLTANVNPATAGGIVVFNVNGKDFAAKIGNGKATYTLSNLAYGYYNAKATYAGDTNYKSSISNTIGFTVEEERYTISAPDVTKYYHGSERFVVTVKEYNKPVAGKVVTIVLNSVPYTRTSNANGQVSIAINLNSGVHQVTSEFEGIKVQSTVTVMPTIYGNNVTKIYRNATQYYATFRDSNGNLLKNTDVNFNINGVFYTRKTNDQGVAKMNINLLPGEYIITAMNPVSTEQSGNLIKVLPSIITYDLTKYYKNASRLTFKLLDNQGRPVGAGVSATININGVFYTRQTNASGYINMNVNLNPGTYIATLDYNGLMASSTVKVLPILEAKDVVMKYRDGTKFEAKLLDGQGRPFAGQTITFNINGVMYNRITDASGVARLNLNLMAGEYIITSMYENGATIANKVTIRS